MRWLQMARAPVPTTVRRYERLGSDLFPHEGVQVAAVAATRSQLRSIVKHHQVLAAEERFDGPYTVDVHDGRAVDSAEHLWIQRGRNAAQVFAHQVRSTTNVQTYVIAFGTDPVDLLGPEENAPVPYGHH